MLGSFVQQILQKDLSHNIMAELQKQHSAAEDLVDQLARFRAANKQKQFEARANQVLSYLQIKQNIAKSLMSIDQGAISRLIGEFVQSSGLLSSLVIQEKKNIELTVLNCIKQVFFIDAEISREDEETRQLGILLELLKVGKQKASQRIAFSRKQLQEIKQLQNKFYQYRIQFEERVKLFNRKIDEMFQKMLVFEARVREDFLSLLGLSEFSSSAHTPQKEIQVEPNHHTPWVRLEADCYGEGPFPTKSTFDSKIPTQEYFD